MEPRSEERRGGGGGHLNLLSPLVPGPVTVTWGGEGGLENWSVTCRERETGWGQTGFKSRAHSDTEQTREGVMGNPRYVV